MLAFMAEYSVLCAVATVKADLVAAAVAKGCNMNDTDQEGNSCLHIAAAQGSNEILRILLNAGAKVSAKNKAGYTSVQLAVEQKHEATVEVLLEAIVAAGMDIDARYESRRERGQTLLMRAFGGFGGGFGFGAPEGNARRKRGQTLLMRASALGLTSTAAKLLALGADIAAKDAWCKTALDVATNDEVKAALRQHGARHSLFYAAEQGMLELVADLIKEGADLNERNKAGNTAVERAQNAQTIDVLKGAVATMPEFPEEKKNDLLLKYAWKGATGGALMAHQAGADVNHKEENGHHHIQFSEQVRGQCNEALAQVLLGAGADINAEDDGGATPLHHCNSPPFAKVLLANGAAVNWGDRNNETVLCWARGHREMEELLLQHGAE